MKFLLKNFSKKRIYRVVMAAARKIQEETIKNLVEPRFERMGGIEYTMSSPGYKHQITAGRLFEQLDAQLSKYGYMPIIAPFDVYSFSV
jgi:hypothetical protein